MLVCRLTGDYGAVRRRLGGGIRGVVGVAAFAGLCVLNASSGAFPVDEVALHEAMSRRCRTLPALARSSEGERDAVAELAWSAFQSAAATRRSNEQAQAVGVDASISPLTVSAVLAHASSAALAVSASSAERLLLGPLLPADPLADLLLREELVKRVATTSALDWKDVLRMIDAAALHLDPRAQTQRIRLFRSWQRSGVLDRGTCKRATIACQTLRAEIDAWESWSTRFDAWIAAVLEHSPKDGCSALRQKILELRFRLRAHGEIARARIALSDAIGAWSKSHQDAPLLARKLRSLLEAGALPARRLRIVSATVTAESRFRLGLAATVLEVSDFEAWLKLGGIEIEPAHNAGDQRTDRERALDRRLHRLDHVERLERLPRASAQPSSAHSGAAHSAVDYASGDGSRRFHSLPPPDDAPRVWACWTGAIAWCDHRHRRMRRTRYGRRGAMRSGGCGNDNTRGPRPCRPHQSAAADALHRVRRTWPSAQGGSGQGATCAGELLRSCARVRRGVWSIVSTPHHDRRGPPD